MNAKLENAQKDKINAQNKLNQQLTEAKSKLSTVQQLVAASFEKEQTNQKEISQLNDKLSLVQTSRDQLMKQKLAEDQSLAQETSTNAILQKEVKEKEQIKTQMNMMQLDIKVKDAKIYAQIQSLAEQA